MIGRTERLLQALAAHPAGLSTPQLALRIREETRPWQQALTRCGNTLRYQEQLGRVIRSGTAPGRWQQGPAIIWRLTLDGLHHLMGERLSDLRYRRGLLAAELAQIDAEIEQLAVDKAVLTKLIARYPGGGG